MNNINKFNSYGLVDHEDSDGCKLVYEESGLKIGRSIGECDTTDDAGPINCLMDKASGVTPSSERLLKRSNHQINLLI